MTHLHDGKPRATSKSAGALAIETAANRLPGEGLGAFMFRLVGAGVLAEGWYAAAQRVRADAPPSVRGALDAMAPKVGAALARTSDPALSAVAAALLTPRTRPRRATR